MCKAQEPERARSVVGTVLWEQNLVQERRGAGKPGSPRVRVLNKESGHYLWAKGIRWLGSRLRTGTELSLRESAATG